MNEQTLVRTLRDDLSLTQTEYARLLGVTQQRVSDWESGARRIGKEGLIALLRIHANDRDLILDIVSTEAEEVTRRQEREPAPIAREVHAN